MILLRRFAYRNAALLLVLISVSHLAPSQQATWIATWGAGEAEVPAFAFAVAFLSVFPLKGICFCFS
jgi:hypothetical protein